MSKPNIKLNTEQKKLVEDNHDLIYGFMTKYRLDFSTWYDVCAIGLCKAGMAYDGSNRFSTFAYYCMHNEVKKAKRTQLAKKRNDSRVISLNTEVKTVYNEDVPLEAVIDSGAKNEEYVVGKDWADWFIEYASTAMLQVLYAKLTECKTCQEVADKLGASKEMVNKQIRILQKHYREGTRPYCRMRYDSKKEREEMKNKVKKALDNLVVM